MKIISVCLRFIPFLTIVFTMFVGCTLRIAGTPLCPALFLIPSYYWILFRPDWSLLWSLFAAGLFYDSLMGYTLGLSSFLLLLSAFLGQYIRPLVITYYFPFVWGGFGLYSFGYLIVYGFSIEGNLMLVLSWLYSLMLYPIVAWWLSHLQNRLPSYV